MGRIAVVGSLNMDMVVRAPRYPLPGETLQGDGFATYPGGKGLNQAAAARRAGAEVTMVGRLGADDFGRTLRAVLAGEGLDDRYVRSDTESATGVAAIHLDPSGQNAIVIVPGANGAVCPADVDAASASVAAADVLVLQGEIGLDACIRAAEVARSAGCLVVYNPAPVPSPGMDLERMLALSDFVLPNEGELRALGGHTDLETAARQLRARTGGPVVATLGEHGALLLRDAHAPAVTGTSHAVAVVDTVGAGDAFVGAFAAAIAAGEGLEAAVAWGLAAGALACTRSGALPSMPSRAEILRLTGPRPH